MEFTSVSFPRINDSIVVRVEKRYMLLKNTHVVMFVARCAIWMVCIRSTQCSGQICLISSHISYTATILQTTYVHVCIILSLYIRH